MSITADYQTSLREAALDALRSVLASHPKTPVADLRALITEQPSLGSVTLSELFGGGGAAVTPAAPRGLGGSSKRAAPKAKDKATPAAAAREPSAAAAPKATAPKPAKARAGDWDTRTEAGRVALDRAVEEALVALGSVEVRAEAIRDRLGATPAQIRTSLNRHIEAGDVTFSGKARGTRYTLER